MLGALRGGEEEEPWHAARGADGGREGDGAEGAAAAAMTTTMTAAASAGPRAATHARPRGHWWRWT